MCERTPRALSLLRRLASAAAELLGSGRRLAPPPLEP
jgi:hypothetical protein